MGDQYGNGGDAVDRIIRDPGIPRDIRRIRALPEAILPPVGRPGRRSREAAIRLAGGLLIETAPVREAVAEAMARIITDLMRRGETEILLALSHRLTAWIILETRSSPSYETICEHLKGLALARIAAGRLDEPRHIVEAFGSIHGGRIAKSQRIRSMVGRIMAELAGSDPLSPVMAAFRTDAEGNRQDAADLMVALGAFTAGPLLAMLRESTDRYERVRVIGVLAAIGPSALPALITEIKGRHPWYYLRNLVMLIGDAGRPEHMPVLEPLLADGDLRLQREALRAIAKMGGPESAEILRRMVIDADDRLKGDAVDLLGELKSRSALSPLAVLVERLDTVEPSAADDLAMRIARALDRIGAPEGISILHKILDRDARKPIEKIVYGGRVGTVAATALARLKQIAPVGTETSALRKQRHLKSWSALHETLTAEESETLYSSLKTYRFDEDRLVYKQGQIKPRLYFIDEGELVLAYDQDDEEIWIKTLRPGDIAGADSFFAASVNTTAMRTVTPARVSVLDRSAFDEWQDSLPELEVKLKAYCQRSGYVLDVLKDYGMERRTDLRLEVPAKVSVQLLNDAGEPEGRPQRGDLLDISAGGLAFFVRRNPASVGRRINIKLLLELADGRLEIDENGRIVAIFERNEASWSVHVRLDRRIASLSADRIQNGDLEIIPPEVPASPGELDDTKDEFLVTKLPG
jgi:CRP-like cAMP-binding protein